MNPHVTYRYHPPALKVALSISETISCTADKTRPIIQVAVSTATPTYLADEAVTWSFSLPNGALSDTDFTAAFTDDGRLASVNSTLTGEGGTVLKDLVSLGTALAAAGGRGEVKTLPVCDGLLKQPVSIVYDASVDFSQAVPAKTALVPRSYLIPIDLALRKVLPDMPSFQAVVTVRTEADNRVTFAGSDLDGQSFAVLKLRPVENAELQIIDTNHGTSVYDSQLAVPVPGPKYYEIALPKPTLFGGSTFALMLSDSGAIKSIGYKKTNGSASAIEVATSAAKAAAPQTAAEKAAELKAEADIIAQQTRLAKCLANRAGCT
jgi:hypothetical protein